MTTDQACPVAPCHCKHPGETQTAAPSSETCSPAACSCVSTPHPAHARVVPQCGTVRPTASQQAQAPRCLTCLQWSCFLVRGGGSCHLTKASSTLQGKRVTCPTCQAGPVLRSPRGFGYWCLQALSPAVSVPCRSPALLMPPFTVGASAALQPTARAVPARGAAEKASGSRAEEGAQQQVDCCLGQQDGRPRQTCSLVRQQRAEQMPGSHQLLRAWDLVHPSLHPQQNEHGSLSLWYAQLQLPTHTEHASFSRSLPAARAGKPHV